ncbi:MAG: hypothetical protein VB050_07060 [Geobacteraceae bacterium]|nr:hypothetical protein [Geobacteraceae bacterium]
MPSRVSDSAYPAADDHLKQSTSCPDLLYNFRPEKTLVPYLAIGGALYQDGTT